MSLACCIACCVGKHESCRVFMQKDSKTNSAILFVPQQLIDYTRHGASVNVKIEHAATKYSIEAAALFHKGQIAHSKAPFSLYLPLFTLFQSSPPVQSSITSVTLLLSSNAPYRYAIFKDLPARSLTHVSSPFSAMHADLSKQQQLLLSAGRCWAARAVQKPPVQQQTLHFGSTCVWYESQQRPYLSSFRVNPGVKRLC